MVTKKEQIAEALRATQMMLNKHSEKMTEEEREKAQEQLKALNQAYSELSQHCSDQTTSAEEDFKSIDGFGGIQSGTVGGLIDYAAGVTFPEAQLMISDLSQSELHLSLDWDDALKNDLVHKSTLSHLLQLNEANKVIQSSPVSSVSLSDIAAAREGSTCEDLVIKMIEVKPVSDGLNVGYTGDTLTLERAFQCGLIPASVYVKILQRQNTCQYMINHSIAENVSLLQPVQEGELCEVSRLILKCLSRNKSQTPERDVKTLKSCCDGLNDEEKTSRLLAAQMDVGDPKECENAGDVMSNIETLQNGDGLKVDAAVQCDLMSSSSVLVMLGNQQQFMGLVLPHSEEIQTVSTSLQYEQQIITDEFISSLFSNCEKIAAIYIPGNSEVVDITSAVQNGFIDTHIAEILKSIEISDVFLDVDHLSEKYSSWLMYKKLRVDGCHDAADDSEVNIPTPTEATQLFISYLMMNSYIDPKSGQRVLILDKQLTKMIQFFLEDSVFSENTARNMTYLTLNVGDGSTQDDFKLPLHINEETEEFEKHTQHTLDPYHFVSSLNERIPIDDETHLNDKALKQDADKMFSRYVSIAWDNPETSVAERDVFQNNISCAGESEEGPCGNNVYKVVEGAASVDLDIRASLGIPVLPRIFSVNSRNIGSCCSVKSSNQPLPHLNTESLCSTSRSIDITPAEVLGSEDSEGNYAVHLMKAQMEEVGSLDVTSGSRYDLEAALTSGLMDENIVLEPLALQLDEKSSVLGDEDDGTMSALEQGVSNGSIPSNTALCVTQQQSQLQSGCTISMSESLQSEVLGDDDEILNLDPKASIYPEEICSHSIPDDRNLGFINVNEEENAQQRPNDRKVSIMVLHLTNEEDDEMQIESENVSAVVECKTEMSNYLYHPSDSDLEPSGRHQVTAECIHHTDKSSVLTDESHGVINSQLTDPADVSSVVIGFAAPAIQSHQSILSDRTPDSNTDIESHTQYDTSAHQSCKADSFPIDFFIAGFDTKVGKQVVSESLSDLDMFPSHRDVSSEETSMKNDTSAAHSPSDCQPTLSIDYSSPRDLIESAVISVSGPHSSTHDKNMTEDGSRMTFPQQGVPHSESDFSSESEPVQTQNDQNMLVGERPPQQSDPSSPLPDANENTATNTVNRESYDVEDLGYYTPTARVSPDPAMTEKDSSGSKNSAANDGELSTVRQHGDIFKVTSDTEQISAPSNAQPEETSDKQNADVVGKVPCSDPTQQAVRHSGSDFSAESEPRLSQSNQNMLVGERPPQQSDPSSPLPDANEITATNTVNHESYDVEDLGYYTPTAARVSPDPAMTEKDSSGSKNSATDDSELNTVRQHGDIFKVTSDTEQIPAPRNAQPEETSDKQNADVEGNVPCSNPSSGSDPDLRQSESGMKEGLEVHVQPERNELDVYDSEKHVVTDVLSHSSVTADDAASAPSVFSNAVRTHVDGQEEVMTEGTDVSGLQKAETQSRFFTIDQNTPQLSDKIGFHESDTTHDLIESSHPDPLLDLMRENTLSLNNKDIPNSELLKEEEVHEKTEQPDAPNIQLQLLQVLKTVSSSQDLSMLQEVMETLNSALGGGSQEERQHILESIKEESSEGEDEGLTEDDLGLCHSPAGSHQLSPQVSANSDICKVEEAKKVFSVQNYLECVGKLQDHADVLDDVRKELLTQAPMSNSMEELQIQVEECQTLKSQLSRLAGVLTADLGKAKQLLNSADENIPIQIHQDLASTYLELEPNFTAVSQMCAERSQSLLQAMETGKVHLESTYQKHLSDLDELAGLIKNNSEMWDVDLNTCDVDTLTHLIQQSKDMESQLLKEARLKLEDVTFDIQCFISEHAQFLSPAQSSYLLKFLSTTQRAFRDQTETLVSQRCTLDVLLDTRKKENQEKSLLEKHKEFTGKLEEVCANLTLTENRLMGHQQQTDNADDITDLQQYQQEHQALQKDVLTNASALNEVITSTKKFLEENRSKLTPEQTAIIESKLEEAKSKAKLINQRAEESRKDLEKVVTTAIKQESEKAAAVERLEESKNKIEGLLDWISNIGNENESGLEETDHISKENGNLPEEKSAKGLIGGDDDANGNALQTTESDSGRKNDACPDLDEQCDKLKAHHQKILSQQQDLIMATQSAQALLDKQANMLSPEEKEKLQKNIQELKERYEASLTQAEQQMKQVQCVQEELKKFQDDCEEFMGWLDQAEEEMEELGAPAASLNIVSDKLQRQKSFSEDVIAHKGDLRFITISGQKVLDVAKACGSADPAAQNTLLHVDTSGTCSAVKDKLDSAATRYKTLHSQCNQLGNNLKDVVDKYNKYEDSRAGLLKWLNSSEEEARKQQSEAIAADPQTLQKQLEETKALQGEMTGHQTAVETLRKTAESLITSEGDLLSNLDEVQETVDDIVERYDNLSKSVSDRNEKLQITLTRSMSVQDGLDEMMGWMERVEASVKEKGQIPLDSASIGDILSKEAALEQDIASRQSSISTMKAKVKKFVETADPSAAALLQSKMEALSQRFSDACDKHKQKVSRLEQLKEKVEEFEEVADKVQQFVVKRSQELHETDGPGKTFDELSQLMENTKAEMAEHAKDLETLQTLSKELSEISPDGNKAQIQSKIDDLLNIFTTFKDTVKEKEEEVSSCQDQLGEFKSAAGALTKWLEETTEKVPVVQPSSSEKSLEKDLQIVTGLLDDWTSKDPAVKDLNSKGSSLCSLITFLTSPAKTKTPNKSALTNGGGPASHSYLTNKELMIIQQNMSFVNEGYTSLGETLESRKAELSSSLQEVKGAQKEVDCMMTWLKDMKKTAASWNDAATKKDSVKTQLEQQKAFEDDMKQKQEQLQKLREKLLNLIETHPNSPEAAKWKQMLAEIDAAWADVSGSVEERKQHLEQSNKNLDVFQTTELQLGQWLSEKEMMMSVLGPLSIDPNMLKMQKQQVQILQNEFKSRKPQYEQLEEAASAILDSLGNEDPSDGKLVKDQLTAVTEKWQGLTGQLDQRDSLIDQAVVKTGQFQELLKSLSQTATQLENQLTNHQAHSTQPDAVKKQLEDVQNISSQLREERKKLKEAETINAELTAMVTEDYLKADLARQLESVSKPFKVLEEKAAKQIEQLSSTFASSQQFHQTSKDFQSWLGEKLQDQSKPQHISAKVDVLQQTLEEHSELQKALSEHEEAYNTIVGEGEMLLQNTDGAEKLALQGQLTTLSSNWQEMKKSSEEQADKLQTALQRSQKYQEHAEKLNTWIQECEASEGRVKLTVDPVAVESSISQVKALQKDVDKHRGMVEQLNTAADSLLEVANADTEDIIEEKDSIGKRMDNVVEGLQNKRESLEKISHTIKEFNDAYKEAKSQLEGAKKQVDAYESQGVQAHSNKNLTNMKAQHKSLEGVQNQVEHLKSLAKELVVDVPDADGVTDLLLQADNIEKDYNTLNNTLDTTCQVLEGKLQGIGQFQNNIREMFSRFTDLDDELDSMAPVDLDLDILKEQQDSIQSFVAKLQELMANTANAGDSCKKMLETESSPDLLGLKRDLDAMSKQCGKLMDRAKGRETQVQSTLTKLEELYGKLHQVEDKLCRAVDKEASQEAVGMETDIINQQLEAFKGISLRCYSGELHAIVPKGHSESCFICLLHQ
ncbi:hypothetical protein PAMP_001765 [Pampus punctatissimus]